MSLEALESNRLRIRRLRVDCLVAYDHPSPERVSRQMADVAEQNLVPALRSILERGVAASDPSLCFIKRLDMVLDVNVDWESDQLARCFAVCATQHLYAEIGDAGNGSNVVRFKNPAEYLASFLCDLVHGQAWTRWYYGPFDGVRALPLSTAIRTALGNHADHALAALHKLDDHSLRQLLTSLTRGDCERAIEALTGEGNTGDQAAIYDAVGAVLGQLPYADVKRFSPECGALWLYIETTRRDLSLSNRAVCEAACVMCRCMRYVDDASACDRDRLFHVLKTGDLSKVDASVMAEAAEWLVPLLSCPKVWRTEFVDLLVHEGRSPSQGQSGSGEPVQSTPFGGIFYLLPFLAELPLETHLPNGRNIDEVAIEAVLRLLILAKVYGAQEALAVARDAVLQELCGIPLGAVSRSMFVECQRRLTVPLLERMARQVVQHGFNIDQQTKPVWVLTTTATHKGAVTLLLDAERGVWLWAVRSSSSCSDLIVRKVRQTLDEWPGGVRLIACDAPYYKALKSMDMFGRVLDLSVSGEEQTEEGQPLKRAVHHLGSLAQELDYLSLPSVFGISRARDRALSILTQTYLRRFASCLPGFSWSTGRYLAQNLFACRATVEQESQRHVVRVSRPPLYLLLNATGLNRRQYTLPWVDSRPFLLFPEDV